MRLGEILRSAGTAQPVNLRPVSFYVLLEDEHFVQNKARATAKLMFVNETEREQVRVDLHADLAKRYPSTQVADSVVRDEEIYHLLVRALRDETPDGNGFHKPFAANVAELRSALHLVEVRRLKTEYEQFTLEEFPHKIDDATWAKLIEDAKKNSATDLLTAYGFENVVQVLSSLAGISGR